MDLLTQGILGAAASQALFGRRLPRAAVIIGFAAGMLADADIFIRPASDPLGGLTYHRHFTHSLLFIPLGALIAAIPFFLVPSLRSQRRTVYLAALAAYATHGLLDACTSYGTMLFWPFSDVRISWDLIAIIDPAFTLPLLIGIILTLWRKRPAAVRISLCFAALYMLFGLVQRNRALDMQQELAAMRGDTIAQGRVFPSPLSLMLWRSVYVNERGELVADGVRVPYLGETTARIGSSARQVTLENIRKEHADDAKFIAGFAQFLWFCDGYAAMHESEPLVIGDMRYCIEPQTFDSLWGFFAGDPLMLPQDPASNHRIVSFGLTRGDRFSRTWEALIGNDPLFHTLAMIRTGFKRR